MNILIEKMLSRANAMYQNWMGRRTYDISESIEVIADIPYLDDGKECHRMDLYRPKNREGKLPVIVNLHGGGLVLCTRAVNRPFCAELAKRGFLVFCVDYPLVPQSDVPGILRDVCAGLNQVEAMVEDYGGDRDRIYLVGDSAGAFLAVYAAAARKSAGIARAAGITALKLPIHGLGLISSMLHTAENDETGFFLRTSFYGRNWRSHPILPYLKPEEQCVASQMPPCFLITTRGDKLRRSTLRFYRGLQSAGKVCELLEFPWNAKMPHDFVIMTPETEAAQQAIDAMTAFLLKNHH